MRKKKTPYRLPPLKENEVRFPCDNTGSHSAHEVANSKMKSLFGQIRHFCEGVDKGEDPSDGERVPYKDPEPIKVYLDCYLDTPHLTHTKPFGDASLDNVYVGMKYPFGDYDYEGNVISVVCLGQNTGDKFGPVDGAPCRELSVHGRHLVGVWLPSKYEALNIPTGRHCPGVNDGKPVHDGIETAPSDRQCVAIYAHKMHVYNYRHPTIGTMSGVDEEFTCPGISEEQAEHILEIKHDTRTNMLKNIDGHLAPFAARINEPYVDGYIAPFEFVPVEKIVGRKTNKRADILSNAEKLINGERADTYGPPEASFSRIANLWNAMGFQMYEKETGPRAVNAVDVSLALTQLKVSRILGQTDHEDSWTDAAGYIALGAEMATRRFDPPVVE